MPRCWSFVSHDDGVLGAAFTAALAHRIAREGKRVLLLELSPTLPTLDLALGVAERVVYTLADALRLSPEAVFLSPEGETDAEQILFVPSLSEEDMNADALRACIEASGADLVLICADPLRAALARTVSDGMLLLTRATECSVRAASRLAATVAFDGFVYTDLVPTREAVLSELPVTELCDALALPLFGILPRVDLKNTLRPQGKDFRTALSSMAGRLLGEQIPLLCGIPIEGMRRRTFFERISR